jgi:hypothetical protein
MTRRATPSSNSWTSSLRRPGPSTTPICWPPAADADRLDGTLFVRRVGAAYRRPSGAVKHLLPTLDGIRSATSLLRPGAVSFQGHVLTTGDFLATWAVELAVHHLDLLTPAAPAPSALRLARLTVEALAGSPFLEPDEEVVLRGTGRTPSDDLRLPVLG